MRLVGWDYPRGLTSRNLHGGLMAANEIERELYSIVIPVFNSTSTLEQIVTRVAAVFSEMPHTDHEMIFVDDASTNPGTWETLKKIAGENPQVRLVQMMRNFGQTSATLCGMGYAKGQYIITMDDDLQHSPEDIPNLIAEKEHDVVMAQFPELKHSLYKRFLSWVKNILLTLLINKPFKLKLTAFRLFRREVCQALLSVVTSPQSTLPPLLFFITQDVVTAPASHHPRTEGESSYTPVRVYRMARNLIFNETVLLLKLIGHLGFGLALLSFLGGVVVFARRTILGTSVVGWASTMLVLLVLGGLILFCLGIIGDYLARLINGVERRPAFVVRRVVSSTDFGDVRPTDPESPPDA